MDTFLNLPTWFILSFSFLLISYWLIKLYFKINKLEFEFTSIVNHAFRTPLTRIMWIAKELEKDLPREEREMNLQSLQNATSRVLGIVDIIAGIKNVKDMSGYSFEAVSIREIVEKSIAKYKEEINRKNISFQVYSFKDIPLLTVDLKKISFVIDVILENAIFYTPENGKVQIECISKSNKIVIYIADTGLGLNFIEKMRIFSKFYRSKHAKLMNTDGMGLGLYLARQIIKRHNGQIYAKSRGRNKGTTFFIELPFSK